MSRIIPALFTFLAVAGLADLTGWGHGYLGLLLLAGWFFLVRKADQKSLDRIMAVACAFSIAVAALAVVQMWFMPRARGPFISPNFLGAYAVLMVFLAAAGHCWPLMAVNGLSLALSQSRGAILALGAGLAVLLHFRAAKCNSAARIALSSACLVAALAIVLSIRTNAGEARFGIWLVALQAASQRLVTGYGQNGLWISGLGSFYSIPIEWLINAGIPGILAGGWLLYEGARAARGQPALLAFLAAWFVQGLFLFSTPTTSIMLFGVLGYLAKKMKATDVADHRMTVIATMAPKPSG